MQIIDRLGEYKWSEIVIAVIVVLLAIKLVIETVDWIINRFGIQFKGKVKQQEYHSRINDVENDIKELATSIKTIADNQESVIDDLKSMHKTIDNLCPKIDRLETQAEGAQDADIEIMHDRISQRCKHYISIGGIPENEYEDFLRFFDVYRRRGGNHGLKDKVDYCKNNLPIIPTNTIVGKE